MAITSLKSIELFFRRLLTNSSKEFAGIYIESAFDGISLSKDSRILFLRPDKFGDMIVSMPVLRTLRKAYPHATIDIVLGKANKSLAQQVSRYVDMIYVYDKSILGLFNLAKSLRSAKYDICIDPLDNPSATSGYLSRLSKARYRVGICKDNAHVYTHCVQPKDRMQFHIVERTAQVLLALGINPAEHSLDCEYVLHKQLQETCNQTIRSLIHPAESMIAVNIAGSVENRTMNEEFAIPFLQAIHSLAKNKGVEIVVFGTKQHHELLEIIKSETDCKIAPFTDSFDEFAAMLHCATMIISPDTSVVHLAASWKTPTLCLFCADNTGTALWTPYNTPHVSLITEGGSINDIHIDKAVIGFKELTSITPIKTVLEQSQRD